MKVTLAVWVAVLLGACTTMAPGATEVRITTDPAWVSSCRAVGSVASSPPYVMPNDDLKQLRNQAVALGGNAVLRTGPRLFVTRGVAYRCSR